MAGGRDCDLWWRETDSPWTVEVVSPATVWEGVEVVLQPCQSDSREAARYGESLYLLPLHPPALDRTEAGGSALGVWRVQPEPDSLGGGELLEGDRGAAEGGAGHGQALPQVLGAHPDLSARGPHVLLPEAQCDHEAGVAGPLDDLCTGVGSPVLLPSTPHADLD